jgi:uncharacterized protein YbbC (DUF1343 family)
MRNQGRLGLLVGGLACACLLFRPPVPKVRPGIDVLLDDSLGLIRGRRVGLLTNQAGVDRNGVDDVTRLRGAPVSLVALFSPEHGFRGTEAPGVAVASSGDSASLPIYSLYDGETADLPDSIFAGIDLMLIDLQDVGARYYTWLWTTVRVMRAADRLKIPVMILDRPNPIGEAVQGNVLDRALSSPVGLLAVPMRHGMTLGELARLARHDLGLSTQLTVVPVAGWRRGLYFDQTGLPFVAPSPNLPRLEAVVQYSGLCLFEGTTLSVGRGTDHPFEQVGAPWLDTALVLRHLWKARLRGVSFSGVAFMPHIPGDGKYADMLVPGVRFLVTDRHRYDPTETAVRLMVILSEISGDRLWPGDTRPLGHLYGADPAALRNLKAAELPALFSRWATDRREFLARRKPFLLYP